MINAPKIVGLLALAVLVSMGAQSSSAADIEAAKPASRGPVGMSKGKTGSYDPDRRIELMTQNLKLTPEQRAKIKPILDEEFKQLEALRGNDSYNRDERRAKLQELNQATYDKISPILTPAQQKKHETVKKIIKERRSTQRGSRPTPEMKGPALNNPERRLKNLTNDLGLSVEQQAKIKPIIEDEFTQLNKLKGSDAYNRDERRTKLQNLNNDTNEKIRQVLTPEQQQKYEQIYQKISDRRSLKKSATPAVPQNRQ